MKHKYYSCTLAALVWLFGLAAGCAEPEEGPNVTPKDSGIMSDLDPTKKGQVGGGGSSDGNGSDFNSKNRETTPGMLSELIGANPDDPNQTLLKGDFNPVLRQGVCTQTHLSLDALGTATELGTIRREFNSQGQPVLESLMGFDSGDISTSYEYDSRDRLKKRTTTGGTASQTESFSYNSDGRLTLRSVKDSAGDTLSETSYSYDNSGRIISRDERVRGMDGMLEDGDLTFYSYPDAATREQTLDDGDGKSNSADRPTGSVRFLDDGRLERSSGAQGNMEYVYQPSKQLQGFKAGGRGMDASFTLDEEGIYLMSLRPWSFEEGARLNDRVDNDRAEITRSSSGAVRKLEIFGSARQTPLGRVDFDGNTCDRSMVQWLELTRDLFEATCPGERPCTRVD